MFDHSWWNLGATERIEKNVLVLISFFLCFLKFKFLKFESVFDPVKSCWNASDARKYILTIITDFYFFWLMNLLGIQTGILVFKILLLQPRFTGVEIMLGHWTWLNIFVTWLVINFPISSFVRSFCKQKIESYVVHF